MSDRPNPDDLLRRLVGEAMGADAGALDSEANLMALGLDSVRVMKISGLLKREGIRLRFAEMMSEPTLGAWLRLTGTTASDAS
ncbi:phosphopantetheine-binding protein [Nocardia macrotermitis]|uniref:Phenyloxazoline synthase MbtB n=1 Tax=Nocardia macrotermitis TaxID=2585198 RepID=A0A7K0DBX3_9NOCA|nr:phosphopantetheine-binding protein [Nocardia macrotermitis]MQY23109.1 Phenyloxazoline synthase MbtB [Nocardia macrotermitis]